MYRKIKEFFCKHDYKRFMVTVWGVLYQCKKCKKIEVKYKN